MNVHSKYYRILGLPDGASKAEVRKAYRKLAMQFHPDRNPDPEAHKRFIELVDAYEILMEERPIKQTINKGSRKEKSTEERKREAEWRYRQQQEREKHEQDLYFNKLTGGRGWWWFKRFAFLSLALGSILFVEPLLPSHFESHRIVSISDRYNGLISPNEVVCIETDRGLKSFVINPWLGAFRSQPEVQIERSFVFRNPIGIWYPEHLHYKWFGIDFSAVNCYPVIPFLFAIPFIIVRYRRKSYWFTLGYYASIYLIAPCVLYFLVTQQRWAHLLTLGLL